MTAILFVMAIMCLGFFFHFIITNSTYKQNERLNNKINKDVPNVFFDPIFESKEIMVEEPKPKRKYTKRVR